MSTPTDTPDVGRELGERLSWMLANGFELPIYFTILSPNGSMICGEYTPNGTRAVDTKFVAERVRPEGIGLPAKVVFMDSRGEIAAMAFESQAEQAH